MKIHVGIMLFYITYMHIILPIRKISFNKKTKNNQQAQNKQNAQKVSLQ